LLLAELQHSVRNTLAVIRSIARRTAQTSDSVDDYAMHLEGRIDAFARVQSAVTRDPLSGVDLEYLIAEELDAHRGREGEQVAVIDGPPVKLKPKAAESLGLAIHELATNAVKYGALSVPAGRISVVWRIEQGGEDPLLVLEWTETGVDVADGEPKRRGFGMELLERTIAYELKAAAELTFTPRGLICVLRVPLSDRVVVG
jgi:two-component system CheB/CheR fusion protein